MNVMPFGKHKGMPIEQVPTDYVKWMLTKANLRNDTRAMLQAALGRRERRDTILGDDPDGQDGHHEAPRRHAPSRRPLSGGGTGAISRSQQPCPACGAMLRVQLGEAMVVDEDESVPF